jgi:hypothetical protein
MSKRLEEWKRKNETIPVIDKPCHWCGKPIGKLDTACIIDKRGLVHNECEELKKQTTV